MGDGSGGANTADSYIGSLISLTSKSEIRYEGILYTVDTENSNIALQNVRSFGTEGRKKEGPPIYASDKVYDYIIFRGSDIKDLQVKSSPSLQPPQPPTDPAIISLQSQFSQPASIPPAYAQPPPGPQDAPPQLSYQGLPPSAFRGGVPHMYQPAAAWGPPPTGPNGNLAMPMYWPGYYRSPGGQMMQQQMPPQPPPSLPQPPIPHPQAPLPQPQAPLPQPQALPPQTSSRPSPPSSLSSSVPPMSSQVQQQPASAPASAQAPAPALSSVSMPAVIGTVPAIPAVPPANTTLPAAVVTAPVSSSTSAALSAPPPVSSASASVPPLMQGISAVVTPASKNPRRVLGAVQPSPPQSQSSGASVGVSSAPIGFSTFPASSTNSNASVAQRSLQAPSQPPGILSASGKTAVLNPLKQEQKGEEPVISQSAVSVPGQTQQQETQPLLPLPTASTPQKQAHHHGNGNVGHTYVRRGRGRGTGRGVGQLAQPTQKFTEDFDFMAMNEKFKKDEVWGELGGGRADGKDKAGEVEEEEVADGNLDDEVVDAPTQKSSQDGSKMPQYVKDDFFDSLSCDAIDREEGRAERTKFSEQRKIDTETFGNFPMRSRGGRRGRRGGFRGGYYGGGYMGGRGNGYGRGRGAPRSATAIN